MKTGSNLNETSIRFVFASIATVNVTAETWWQIGVFNREIEVRIDRVPESITFCRLQLFPYCHNVLY